MTERPVSDVRSFHKWGPVLVLVFFIDYTHLHTHICLHASCTDSHIKQHTYEKVVKLKKIPTFRQLASPRKTPHPFFPVSNLFSLFMTSAQGVTHERAVHKRELISWFLKHAAFIFTICSCTSPALPVTCACVHVCVCMCEEWALELKMRGNLRTYDEEKRDRLLLSSWEELFSQHL